MDLSSGVRSYVTEEYRKAPLLDEPDAKAVIQSWHTFDEGERYWIPISPHNSSTTSGDTIGPDGASRRTFGLVLMTWNLDAFAHHPRARMAAIFSAIQNEATIKPDVLFFQEVSWDALDFLLADPWVRDNWYSSEADETQWTGVPFATIMLLSKHSFGHGNDTTKSRIGLAWRVKYQSRFSRDALCTELFLSPAGTRVRLANVHLDSLAIQPSFRPRQLAIVANMLHNAGRGVVAGDFNPVLPEDGALVAENRLVDAWTEVHPGEDGFTWGVDGKGRYPPGRLDKIAMVGLKATDVIVIHPGFLRSSDQGNNQQGHAGERQVTFGANRPTPWSDHSGLVCTLELVGLE